MAGAYEVDRGCVVTDLNLAPVPRLALEINEACAALSVSWEHPAPAH